MKILLSLLSYGKLTGSEMYVYELAKELLKLKYQVSIASLATDLNSELVARLQHPHLKYYQLGDVPNDYDIVHSSQTKPTELVKMMFKCPIIQTIHSEILDEYESPVDGISHYIAIRPKIFERLVDKYPTTQISEVYNGVDRERFFPTNNPKQKVIVFCGTLNKLRLEAIRDLKSYIEKGYKLVFVGDGFDGMQDTDDIMYLSPRWNIEELLHNAELTAGIMLGRTTIEGYQCGLGAIIYHVDKDGNILDKQETGPRPQKQYYSDYMAKEMDKIYRRYVK